MTAEGTVRQHFDQDADVVFALVTDPGFLQRRAESAGERSVVVQIDRNPFLKIQITREVERNIPSLMKKVLNPKSRLVDVQTWETAGPVKSSGWTVQIGDNRRVELRGRLTIAPATGGGCDYIEAFSVTVAIPLIGGRVEKYIAGETEAAIRQHLVFTGKQLAGR